MKNFLSSRVQQIKPSPTLAISGLARELKAAGEDVIDLSLGEPDFDTPEFIKAAAVEALKQGHTKYTAVEGIVPLRRAIVEKFKKENQLDYQIEQILVSSGAKQSLFNLFSAVINAGDEVIIPAPYWVSYPDMVLLCDGVPVSISTTIEQRFKITAEQLEAAITPKTKLLILNSPSNPTGMAYSKAELQKLAEVLLRHPHVLVVSDDIYEHIRWMDEPFVNIVNACPELMERVVVVNGVSKAYAMTGWRIGYCAGPKYLIDAMKKIQSQMTSNPNSIAQDAAVAALTGDQSCVKMMCAEFKKRHDFVVKRVNSIAGLRCAPGDGTFYAFINVEALFSEQLKADNDVASLLLKEALVAVVPGSGFGTPGYIRISFATSMAILEKSFDRIATAIAQLKTCTT